MYTRRMEDKIKSRGKKISLVRRSIGNSREEIRRNNWKRWRHLYSDLLLGRENRQIRFLLLRNFSMFLQLEKHFNNSIILQAN